MKVFFLLSFSDLSHHRTCRSAYGGSLFTMQPLSNFSIYTFLVAYETSPVKNTFFPSYTRLIYSERSE
ncbi:hypothetical protein [Bacteroides helcogenes]|uniref:hypothetical protein n=1 Tax=Bacteroides helcogenes TaxID=290053 RepID=UPI001651AE2D|nr:hypothetical protein [Bacteroides helcogenes]